MPVKDGFTLAKEIRMVDKNIPIIFLTAKAMPDDKIEGFQAGADDYMTKPFNMEEAAAAYPCHFETLVVQPHRTRRRGHVLLGQIHV